MLSVLGGGCENMSSRFFSISEMVDIATKKYVLNDYGDFKKNFSAVVRRAIKKLGYVDVDDINVKYEMRCKSRTKVYSSEVMYQLFNTEGIYNYITSVSKSDVIRNRVPYAELLKEIDMRKEREIKRIENMEPFDDACPILSDEVFVRHKMGIMVEAIFNQFYTKFDDELLRHDLSLGLLSDEFNVTPELVEAEQRYRNPEGNYYRKK